MPGDIEEAKAFFEQVLPSLRVRQLLSYIPVGRREGLHDFPLAMDVNDEHV